MTILTRVSGPGWVCRLRMAAVCLAISACAAPPALHFPEPLKPTDREHWLMQVAARGVQIYECRPAASGSAWIHVGPQAELFDAAGRTVGRHGAGLVWQALDGSRVTGEPIAHADAPSADAVPWLLLRTRDSGASGSFSAVIRIRRINMVGGAAPRGGCGQHTHGAIARVPYSADDILYTSRRIVASGSAS